MPQVNLSNSEFEDIVVLFLLDKVMGNNKNEVNKSFDDLVLKLNRSGVKQYLYKCFLEMPGDSKVKYNRIKKILDGKKGQAAIIITEEFVREIVSKVVGKENPNPRKLKQLLEELDDEI